MECDVPGKDWCETFIGQMHAARVNFHSAKLPASDGRAVRLFCRSVDERLNVLFPHFDKYSRGENQGNPEEVVIKDSISVKLAPDYAVLHSISLTNLLSLMEAMALFLERYMLQLCDPKLNYQAAQWIFGFMLALPSPPSLMEASDLALLRNFVRCLQAQKMKIQALDRAFYCIPTLKSSLQAVFTSSIMAIAAVAIICGQRDLLEPQWT